MIQPGLIPLQPNLDFMDTFEPFQGEDMGQRKHGYRHLLCPGQRAGASLSQRALLECAGHVGRT